MPELQDHLDATTAAVSKVLEHVDHVKTSLNEKDHAVVQSATHSHQNLTQLATEIDAVGKELDGGRHALQAEFAHVADAVEKANDLVDHFHQHLGELTQNVDHAVHDAETQLTECEHHLTEALGTVLHQVESLKGRAESLTHDLQGLVTEAIQFLQHDFQAEMESIHQAIDAKTQELTSQIHDQVLPALVEQSEKLNHEIQDALQKLSHQAKQTTEHLHTESAATVQQAHDTFDRQGIDHVQQSKESARHVSENSGSAMIDVARQVTHGSQTLIQAGDTASGGMEAVIDILEHLKNIFQKLL